MSAQYEKTQHSVRNVHERGGEADDPKESHRIKSDAQLQRGLQEGKRRYEKASLHNDRDDRSFWLHGRFGQGAVRRHPPDRQDPIPVQRRANDAAGG